MLPSFEALRFELEAAISAKAEMEMENERMLLENYHLKLQNEALVLFIQHLTMNASEVPNHENMQVNGEPACGRS